MLLPGILGLAGLPLLTVHPLRLRLPPVRTYQKYRIRRRASR
jgi:hypothetical protein